MSNFLSRIYKKLKFWLFEERDDIYAKELKRRKVLHNVNLIQTCLVVTIIGSMLLIPLILWLLALKDFALIYLFSSLAAGIFYLTVSSYIKHLNKQYEQN